MGTFVLVLQAQYNKIRCGDLSFGIIIERKPRTPLFFLYWSCMKGEHVCVWDNSSERIVLLLEMRALNIKHQFKINHQTKASIKKVTCSTIPSSSNLLPKSLFKPIDEIQRIPEARMTHGSIPSPLKKSIHSPPNERRSFIHREMQYQIIAHPHSQGWLSSSSLLQQLSYLNLNLHIGCLLQWFFMTIQSQTYCYRPPVVGSTSGHDLSSTLWLLEASPPTLVIT